MTSLPRKWPARSLKECDDIMCAPGMPLEWEHKTIKGRRIRVYKKQIPTLRDFWNMTKGYGSREYLVYKDQRLTYAQTHALTNRIANLLLKDGVKKGDSVAIVMRNLPEWVAAFYATHMIGAIAVAVNAWSPTNVLEHCITLADSKVILVDEERMQSLAQSTSRLAKAGVKRFYAVRTSRLLPGFTSFEEVLASILEKPLPNVSILPDDSATIFFTSGTTSLPKGVLSTNRQFMANFTNSGCTRVRVLLRRGEGFPFPDLAAPQKTMLLCIPLFHATSNQSFLTSATAGGMRVIILHKWDAKAALEIIKKDQVHLTGGVPFIVTELIDMAKDLGDKNPLDTISFGGAPVSNRVPDQISKEMPNVLVGQGYGLTEVNAVAAAFGGEDYLHRPESTGLAPPAVELKIMSLDRKHEMPRGEPGEIFIRGPNVAECYYKDAKATAEAFLPDGWFASGDIGKMDEEGFLYVMDRAKDIIIRGGENISAGQVENALFSHDQVKEASVVAVPDERLGELVAAVVVVKSKQSAPSEQELQDVVAKQLPKHCVPVMIMIQTDDVPRNAAGKVLKKDLKTKLAKIWTENVKAGKVKSKL